MILSSNQIRLQPVFQKATGERSYSHDQCKLESSSGLLSFALNKQEVSQAKNRSSVLNYRSYYWNKRLQNAVLSAFAQIVLPWIDARLFKSPQIVLEHPQSWPPKSFTVLSRLFKAFPPALKIEDLLDFVFENRPSWAALKSPNNCSFQEHGLPLAKCRRCTSDSLNPYLGNPGCASTSSIQE